MRTSKASTAASPSLVTPGRLFGLTDGIFAISITLLALDVRLPDDVADGLQGFKEGHAELYGRFGVFLLAFWIATRFWLSNHAAMAHVHHVDRTLLSRTVVFLAGISSIPIATNVLVEAGSSPEAVTFACAIIAVTWVLEANVWWYLSNPANGLSEADPRARVDRLLDNLYSAVLFALAIPLAFLLDALGHSSANAMWILLLLRFDRFFVRRIGRLVRR